MVRIKRVYDPASPDDGKRILVDRLWPRGLKKEKARIDEWMKEVAPSNELRKWFSHDPGRWLEFKRRYSGELRDKGELLGRLRMEAGKGRITFLFSAKDLKHNNAAALKEAVDKRTH